MKIAVETVNAHVGKCLTPENFPPMSWFVYCGEVHQVLAWKGRVCRIFDYDCDTEDNWSQDDTDRSYFPISELHIRAVV